MEKRSRRAQFYLVTTIIIIAIILGFASLSNFVQKRSTLKFYYEGEELSIESEHVLDYTLISLEAGEARKTQIKDFIDNYTEYSEAENFYFLFGNSEELIFRGYKKSENGSVIIETDAGTEEIDLLKGIYSERTIDSGSLGEFANLTITEEGESLSFDFKLIETGTNFYYVISREIGGDRYLETNA